jgi:iron-sulfur cluster assembly protein
MLALTSNASLAIEEILNVPTVPDGAGLRIAPPPGVEADDAEQFQVTVARGPAESDHVIDEEGARLFVDESVAPRLQDKLLDADIVEDRVQFTLADAQGGTE